VRGNHCYVSQGLSSGDLYVLNVSDPANPWQEGMLSGLLAEGIYLLDTLLFTPGFDVVNIADSSRPTLIANEPAGGGEVWVHDSLRYGVTAGWTGGLRVLNLGNIADPVLDTAILGTYSCADISVKGGLACVASQQNYMLLFDISDPTDPSEVGRYIAPGGGMESVLNAESLAYVPAYAHTHDTVLHAVVKNMVEVMNVKASAIRLLNRENNELVLNSVGDKSCRPAYVETLRAALREHAEKMCGDCQRRVETNPLRVLDCKVPGDQAIIDGLVQDDELDAFVFDRAVLAYLTKTEFPYQVEVLPDHFDPYYVSVAMQPGSELREPIDRAILQLMVSDSWSRLIATYVGTGPHGRE